MGRERSFMKNILIPYFFCIILTIFIVIILLTQNYAITIDKNISVDKVYINNEYIWPVIGYNRISSYFGKRNAPTKGASTYHSGIDIAAPTGSNLVSIMDGKIVYVGFNGAGGYTIIIQNGNMKASYCHVHNSYLPKLNTIVKKGEIIGKVGPKNVYDVPNNPYKDNNGNPTNGATTGPHLHFSIKIDNEYVNPLNILSFQK